MTAQVYIVKTTHTRTHQAGDESDTSYGGVWQHALAPSQANSKPGQPWTG
jgi:hypothetical protein